MDRYRPREEESISLMMKMMMVVSHLKLATIIHIAQKLHIL